MMQRVVKTIASLCLVLLLAVQAGAANLEDKVVEHTFKNGLKLLMVERHSSPTVSAWIRFKVGSVHERSDERGLAHLLEHMLFKGTRTLGTKDYAAEARCWKRLSRRPS
jgi:predicted Zn-dependent peptidase